MGENDPGLWIGLSLLAAILAIAWLVGALRQRSRRGRSYDYPATYRLRSRLRRMARPTLLLFPAKSPGFSKLGGLPELPADTAWPEFEGRPPAFVAQLDLAAFAAHAGMPWLPHEGRLYFFFDEARNGALDCCVAIYSLEPPGPPVAFPAPLAASQRFAELRVGFMRFTSLPSWDWLGEDEPGPEIDWEGFDLLADADLGDEIEHRVGGYPSEIQGGQMGVHCEYLWRGLAWDPDGPVPDDIRRAGRQWRLLLQIDSDPALGMNWWDGGRIYVFVRARDARRGDFRKTVTITQTH
ncbi:MAG: DUF1963 domain-containing protein [Phenylobacterium sp.]|uniref:YwqG family protein n=1 Tax=Phenylobacterium sp. TaxID=1871053 RepID=UPI001A52429B|nr:YwqG family protein [Phenylobacterium sp.]MBL8773928.1 DUF1963 domain-containing protein [Phenylobacterium sp.]